MIPRTDRNTLTTGGQKTVVLPPGQAGRGTGSGASQRRLLAPLQNPGEKQSPGAVDQGTRWLGDVAEHEGVLGIEVLVHLCQQRGLNGDRQPVDAEESEIREIVERLPRRRRGGVSAVVIVASVSELSNVGAAREVERLLDGSSVNGQGDGPDVDAREVRVDRDGHVERWAGEL